MVDIDLLKKSNMDDARVKLRKGLTDDLLVINAINTLEDLDVQINSLSMRLKDWYGFVNPELVRDLKDYSVLSKVVLEGFEVSEFGVVLGKKEKDLLLNYAGVLKSLLSFKNYLEDYLKNICEKHMPNFSYLAGFRITAKLLREARSLKRLATMQSSTIQLLGAEKALFRHIKTGAKNPKYGYILSHELVKNSRDKGKAARLLSDKLSLCARLDYFMGDFKASEYEAEIMAKLK